MARSDRYGIDRDALIPITKHDEKKVSSSSSGLFTEPALGHLLMIDAKALAMLRRPAEKMPKKWRCVLVRGYAN